MGKSRTPKPTTGLATTVTSTKHVPVSPVDRAEMPQYPTDWYDIPDAYQGTLEPNFYCRGWNPRRIKYCRAPAGRGTDHDGVGRCSFHGGNSGALSHGRYSKLNHVRLRDLIEEFRYDPELLDIEDDVAACRALFVDFIERYQVMTDALLAWHRSWEAEQLELPEELVMSFERVIEEFEIIIREGAVEPTEQQMAGVQGARRFLDILRGRAGGTGRPRKILDIADAHKMLATTATMIAGIEKARAENAISRRDFFRLTDQMGVAVMKHVGRALEVRLAELSPEQLNNPDELRKVKDACLRSIQEDWMSLALS